jgi:tripartite-type tricarboxylate transporter receptor subunit TctC
MAVMFGPGVGAGRQVPERDQTLRLIVPFAAGGGVDTRAPADGDCASSS